MTLEKRYHCPICKQHRGSKLHTDKCSKQAKKICEPAPTEVKKYKHDDLPLEPPRYSRALNRFH